MSQDIRHPGQPRGTAAFLERFVVGPSGHGAKPGVTPSGSALPAHDLDERVPGIRALREATQGSPEVTIVILDGTPDLTVSALQSERISRVFPYWIKRAPLLTAEQHALFREITESDLTDEARDARFLAEFTNEELFRFIGDRHATHIASVIAGQPGSPVLGLAPNCRVIVVPLNEHGSEEEFISGLNLARAFELAQELGADIIHCAVCHPTQTDTPPEQLLHAVQACVDAGILVISPAGNNAGDCRCIPSILPGTLGVGALKEDGTPFKFSNWGGNLATDGIMALGADILGAQPGTEEPTREKGTSVSAPLITAVSALFMSLQEARDGSKDGRAIRELLLETVSPPPEGPEAARYLRGCLNLPAAMMRFNGTDAETVIPAANVSDAEPVPEPVANTRSMPEVSDDPSGAVMIPAIEPRAADTESDPASEEDQSAALRPSTAHTGLVFSIGTLAIEFETHAQRDDFEQAMKRSAAAGGTHGTSVGAIEDVIDFLDQNPVERRHVTWLVEHDDAPIYALNPDGAYADQIYETLLHSLAGQHTHGKFGPIVERVSAPGVRTGKVRILASGAEVEELSISEARGLFAWNVETLVQDAVASLMVERPETSAASLHAALSQLLRRIYFELYSLGQASRDRAMNFAATNCFQAADVLARALAGNRILDKLVVAKSPLGRLRSDCWELSLIFYDPNNDHRAAVIHQFTIDVSQVQPVTVGDIRTWAMRR